MATIRITREDAKILEEAKIIKRKQKESARRTNAMVTPATRKAATKKRRETINSNKQKV